MLSYRENLQKCHEYVRALEEERQKIQMFQRELPLCLEIVTQTIESCKQQLSGANTTTLTATATTTTTECSEQTTSDGLVFEEFIPINKISPAPQQQQQQQLLVEEEDNNELESLKKSDWLRSAQLWNQSPDPPTPTPTPTPTKEEEEEPRKEVVVVVQSPSSCSSAERGSSKKEDGQTRKARRCWSPELHRRFLNSLEQLGGPHVATPKQIRELMKVDGLTNDEVKSHLQKYRLHSSRRPTTGSAPHNNTKSTEAPQFVVVGGLWVPPTPNPNPNPSSDGVIYAPVALQQKPHHQATITSQSDKSVRCNSPASSSSAARAASASPAAC